MKRIFKYSVSLVREASNLYETNVIRCPGDIADIMIPYFKNKDREYFTIMLLDQKHKVIGLNDVSMGSLTATVVHPREVFKTAILLNAAAIVCSHNHPSGDPRPSQEDINITKNLKKSGNILGIEVIDHVIIGDHKYVSLMEEGIITK